MPQKRRRLSTPVVTTQIHPLTVATAQSLAACPCRIRIASDRKSMIVLNNCPNGIHD